MNRTGIIRLVVTVLFLSSFACVSKQPPAPEGVQRPARFEPAKATAVVSGRIALEGEAPRPAELRLAADPACAEMHREPLYSEEIVARDGRLQNVFVWVKQGLEKYSFAPPAEPVTLTQERCHYSPHVGGIMVNQKLQIVNSDPTLHNIHCMAENNAQFNIGQAVQGMSAERSFTAPEVMVRFKCDVHNWMSCYLGVVPHPYFAITGQQGTYQLNKLPPGDYVIEAWHEKLGTRTQKVTLRDNEAREVDFTFSASL